MRSMLAGMTAALMLAGCGGGASRDAVDGAWVRLPAVPGRPAAAYFTVHGGERARTLVTVATPIAARAELHESMAGQHGTMAMRPLTSVPVPAGATAAFAPAGRHVMLFDVTANAKAGGTAPLTLTFADGGTLTAQAKLLAAGDPAPTVTD